MPKITIHKARIFIISFLSLLLFFVLGYKVGAAGFQADLKTFPRVTVNRQVPPEKNINFDLFWRVWDNLQANYYDKSKINQGDLVYGAIKGMVDAVGDPYTIFLTPQENKITNDDLQGNFEGVGIQIGFRGKQLAVISPLPGSPAEGAGVKSGDFIVGIKDPVKGIERGTVGITLPEAVELIRGPAGSKITLSLLRDGSDIPVNVDITRKTIDVPSVILTYVGGAEDVARVQVLKFGAETKIEWDKAVLDILKKDDLKGLVVDLRNNPGGYLQGAVDLGSDFLNIGDTVVIEEKGDGTQDQFKADRIGRLRNIKTAVLVNGGSASASEILAGALRDDKGITLVGEKSFGKGTIQEPLDLENGVGLHITIAKWLTPKGTWVNEDGLEPDIKVSDNTDTKEDEQLDKAIEYINS